MSDEKKLQYWLDNQKYLPEFIQDFHDQKDLFKAMHHEYENRKEVTPVIPSWITGHIYVIDWFLWYMANRGYTLQKSREKLKFRDFEEPPKADITLLSDFLKKGDIDE